MSGARENRATGGERLGAFRLLARGVREEMQLPTLTLMTAILNFCCVLSVVCLLSLVAGNVSDRRDSAAEVKSEATVSPPAPAQASIFNPHARAKAVQYFDTYRAEPYGLPPGCVAMMNPIEDPASAANIGVSVGQIVKESERAGLLDAPSDLVRVFPPQPEGVRYCLAGNQLIVVDGNCRVLDSIRIPTIRLIGGDQLSASVNLAVQQF